jgi:hypothetical protein
MAADRAVKTVSLAGIAFAAAAATYVLMAVLGRGGATWITNTRLAYIESRAGVGVLWAATSWCLLIGLLALIWGSRRTTTSITAVAAVMLLSSLLGSKAAVVMPIVLAVFHYHLRRQSVATSGVVMLAFLVTSVFALTMALQNSTESATSLVSYLAEYCHTACRAIDLLGPQGAWFLGEAWLSSFWEFMPRAMFPAKPLVYGQVMVHDALAPGMAELGHTPGVPGWMLGFAEIGWAGIAASGFMVGRAHDAVHAVLRRREPTLANFLLYVQLVLFPVLIYSNVLSTLAIYWFLKYSTAGPKARSNPIGGRPDPG